LEASQKINVFWFRRDLRLDDNAGLYNALKSQIPILLIFIFDKNILDDLNDIYDPRITFIHGQLNDLNKELASYKSSILVKHGTPEDVFKSLIKTYYIECVYCNEDYEPYAISRDRSIKRYLKNHGIEFKSFKDHVIFHKTDILNDKNEPYKVFSAYKKKWLEKLLLTELAVYKSKTYLDNLYRSEIEDIIELKDIGFRDGRFPFPDKKIDPYIVRNYDKTRDFPYMNGTTRLGIHFRHGTISIRKAVAFAKRYNLTWLNELIWREFYSMILYYYPGVVTKSFKSTYDNLEWINHEDDFICWREGKTGYPIVDAGMRQLNKTGYMHNRLRMITASFLTKHLLIDWRWGEAYFAKKLLDYDLSSNNGGWQWAAGTGTDSQPYFRIFNPYEQARKFDPDFIYIKKWLPEYSDKNYPKPLIDHKFARLRAINAYKKALI
jgi:deoxyribodipyrimidine photo-lyase